ncbi:MAG: ferredoxin-NAD reductase [Cytophagales bacterium]|nr:MAG: ferredoxin-NAD reductase [Cytophagales bacterium]
MTGQVVIVGSGHAGFQAAASLREEGFAGGITLVSADDGLPSQKPPLSKGFLQGKQTEESLLFRVPAWYETNAVTLRLGVRVVQIDPLGSQLKTETGDAIPYTHLILATGAANRPLPCPGADDVLYLRNLADARRIGARLEQARRVAIVGGGFIGLELAAVAAENRKTVTVVEAGSRLMERVLPPVLSGVFRRVHEQQGVQIRLNTVAQCIEKQNESYSIQLSDGQTVAADLVLAGIGVIPETNLAQAAGLVCDNGIVVNEYGQTSVSNIYAVGDCANQYNPFARRRLRLESVQNAVDQAKTAAKHLMGEAHPYRVVPWFWTHQYHLKLQMAGISAGYDQFSVAGNPETDTFSVYYYADGQLIAVDSLNRPGDHLKARKLLEAGSCLPAHSER